MQSTPNVLRQFRFRSVERDFAADMTSITAVEAAIDHALKKLESERDGLVRRIQEATDRAAMLVGTDTDEYLVRDNETTAALGRLESEMERGNCRLDRLNRYLTDIHFIRSEFKSRFSDTGYY